MNVDEIKKMLKAKQDVEGEAESTHCASSCDSYDCDAISTSRCGPEIRSRLIHESGFELRANVVSLQPQTQGMQ